MCLSCSVLVGSPRLNGSDFFGNPVEEGGVYSCPFDNSQSCTVESIFQTKDGESTASLLSPSPCFSFLVLFAFLVLCLTFFYPISILPPLLAFSSLSPKTHLSPSLFSTDSNPLAQDLFTLLSDDSRAFDGQLLGFSLRSFENHVVVSP